MTYIHTYTLSLSLSLSCARSLSLTHNLSLSLTLSLSHTHLADVVGDIIDHVHLELLCCFAKHHLTHSLKSQTKHLH
jgi:hypothetical protein